MKNKLISFLMLFCLVLTLIAAAPPNKNLLNKYEVVKQECFCPIAVGVVRLENGIGVIEHAGLDWDSVPVFSLYASDSLPGATVTVCWAVSDKMEICSTDPNDNSLYSFVIYNGKAPGVIFPTPK